jgi:RNA polymerase sigma-70 factor (ECF subfamily)
MGSLHQLHLSAGSEAGADASSREHRDLIGAAAQGDLVAFEQLYRRYSPQIYGLCLRMTGQRESAEDCTQECFIDAWRALERFQGRSAFATWLHAIAVRCVLSKRRGLRARLEVGASDQDLPERTDGSWEQPLDVERAIAQLPEGARDTLTLVGIYGYSHREAASLLGVAEGTCKAQLHRARQLLAKALHLEHT